MHLQVMYWSFRIQNNNLYYYNEVQFENLIRNQIENLIVNVIYYQIENLIEIQIENLIVKVIYYQIENLINLI